MPPTDSLALSLLNSATECEKSVITRLIRLVELALQCSNSGNSSSSLIEIDSEDETFAKNFMEILLNQNDTRGSSQNENSSITPVSENTIIQQSGGGDHNGKLHRLQHLEMIKVGVLIFVISIIMLTTCRMVFQLFVRFRPEKPQLH